MSDSVIRTALLAKKTYILCHDAAPDNFILKVYVEMVFFPCKRSRFIKPFHCKCHIQRHLRICRSKIRLHILCSLIFDLHHPLSDMYQKLFGLFLFNNRRYRLPI